MTGASAAQRAIVWQSRKFSLFIARKKQPAAAYLYGLNQSADDRLQRFETVRYFLEKRNIIFRTKDRYQDERIHFLLTHVECCFP